ncbi:DMT family transporter [candidate division KSB1 bacterium]
MLLVSSASIIIRYTEAPPLAIAFYRVFFASLLIFIFQSKKTVEEIRSYSKNTIFITAAAGFFLALHFAAFIISLSYTTVANSVILVDSAPLFALLLSYLILKESAKLTSILAVIVALTGAAVISWGDISTDPALFKGDLYAIAGAAALAVYLVFGRIIRPKVSLTPYLVLVYGFAALFLGSICILNRVAFFGYSGIVYMLFLMLAILPTVGGHSMFLYTLKYLKAYVVNLGFLGEPVGAAILAYVFFREVPHWYFYFGGIMIFAGLVFVIINEEKNKEVLKEI